MPTHSKSEVVVDPELVGLVALQPFSHGRLCRPLEPGGGTPWILAGDVDEAVFHRVFLHIPQVRPPGVFEGDAAVPELIPDLPPWGDVELIDGLGGFHVELAEEFPEVPGIVRRGGDEVVVVGENGPRLEGPAEVGGVFEEMLLEKIESGGFAEEVLLLQGTGGDMSPLSIRGDTSPRSKASSCRCTPRSSLIFAGYADLDGCGEGFFHARLAALYASSRLRQELDREAANRLLVEIRGEVRG